ncbi:MAG: hypothetical protein EOP84_02915 [Verrucomicrobiaceae bacterium]|nr:MAG: hypothetical protein EOP84_02915 [Verrucomicrobiaceae bacterium]
MRMVLSPGGTKTNLAHVISYYEPRPAVQNDADFYVERIEWCQEHFGQPILISEQALDYDILRRGRMDTNNKWVFFEERFYFRDLNQAFEFKMRWL